MVEDLITIAQQSLPFAESRAEGDDLSALTKYKEGIENNVEAAIAALKAKFFEGEESEINKERFA